MSVPISATITSAAAAPDPRDRLAAGAAASAKGAITSSIRRRTARSAPPAGSTWSISIRSRNRWWSVTRPVQRLPQLRDLLPQPPRASSASALGVVRPGDQPRDHGPARDPEHVGGHARPA